MTEICTKHIRTAFSHELFLPMFTSTMTKKISNEEKQEAIRFIKAHFGRISQREMARQLGLGKTTVNNWSAEIGLKHKKHTVNENFFDHFNEESVYLLGLIYADGNIAWNPQKGYQAMTITAAAKDKDHLERLRHVLQSTKPLLYSKCTNSYRLIVNSKKICLRLMQLGVFPRKSLTVTFPDVIPNDHLHHFLRGVIDGDGTIYYIDRKKSPYFSIKICSGSEIFLKGFTRAIKKIFDIQGNVRKTKQGIYVVEYSCLRGKKLAKVLYSDANIFLERKYLPYKNHILEDIKNDKQ